MKKLFSVDQNYTQAHTLLLIARVAIATLMLSHGWPKMQMLLSGGAENFPSVLGMGSVLSLTMAVFAEVFCSVLILVGFGTRLAAVPLIITMAVAVFYIHAADPFTKQEMGLLYLLVYVLLLIGGSGRYSIDHLLQRQPAVNKNR